MKISFHNLGLFAWFCDRLAFELTNFTVNCERGLDIYVDNIPKELLDELKACEEAEELTFNATI